MINEVSRPMSHHVPVEKICEKLKKKDSQICELKYGEQEESVGAAGGRQAAGVLLFWFWLWVWVWAAPPAPGRRGRCCP